MLKNLQNSAMVCLSMEHTPWRGRQIQNFPERYLEFISGGSFTKQQILQANDTVHEGMELSTKNIRSSNEHQDHQANTYYHDG